MKTLLIILGISVALMATDGKSLTSKCVACHGANFEKAALGKSAVVKGQKAQAIETSLKGYKAGTINNNGMGGLMKTQVAQLSDGDIKVISTYIATIK